MTAETKMFRAPDQNAVACDYCLLAITTERMSFYHPFRQGKLLVIVVCFEVKMSDFILNK